MNRRERIEPQMLIILIEVYRADPNTRLRADIGFIPCDSFFPLFARSLSMLF